MIVVFTGSRHLKLTENITERISAGVASASTVFVGDCPTGLDLYVRNYCDTEGFTYYKVQAYWDLEGRAAGPRRNMRMLDAAAALGIAITEDVTVYAFPRGASTGTRGCMQLAERRDCLVEEC